MSYPNQLNNFKDWLCFPPPPPKIPNKYLDIHQSPLFQQIKEKKNLVKKQF